MAKRSLYSRVTRRLRHIADADEVRGLKKPAVATSDADAAPAPLLRYLQPIVALAGAAALVAFVIWLIAH
ncbi:MAG: hypothetical protein ACT4P4_25810 [Betaproteobacteria bacterium]